MNSKKIMDKTNPAATHNERQLWHGTPVTLSQHGPMPITAINACGFIRNQTRNSGGNFVLTNNNINNFSLNKGKDRRGCSESHLTSHDVCMALLV